MERREPGGWRERIREDWRTSGPVTRAVVTCLAGLFAVVLLDRLPRPRPEPPRLSVSGSVPGPTRLVDGARPDSLFIEFGGSAARLDAIGKNPGRGVTLYPALKGRWRWESDRRLVFTPTEDWGVDQAYRVRLDPKLFPDRVRLETYEYRFTSARFSARLESVSFYVDPRDPAIKQLAATIVFSHAVDTRSLEKRVAAVFDEAGHGLFRGGRRPLAVSVSYDKFMGQAYLRSDAVAIPDEESKIYLAVASGVRAARGGRPLDEKLEASVRVPGMYDFFHISAARTQIVRDENYAPGQVLIVEGTTGIDEKAAAAAVHAWALPENRPATALEKEIKRYGWPGPDEIGPEVLALSTPVALAPIPADRDWAPAQSFRFKAPPGRRLLIRVDKGLAAFGGYVLAKTFEATAPAPEYPAELKIMHDGAILNLSGGHKLSIFSQELEGLRFEVGRVLPGEINHLASQTEGDFARPGFQNYRFGQDDITERFSETRALVRGEPGKAQYSAFDFSKYLASRRGLFFFRVERWDPVRKRAGGLSDSRLILVTDLGLVVKDAADGSHDVFVQSLADGRPAAGTVVEVLGKNGLPVVSAAAGESGRAHFPKLSDFTRERTPVVYLAKRGEDLSFLPFDRADRRVDYSRFDVGGEVAGARGERLQTYLFSDRGVYRPGDAVHVGLLVRSLDWGPSVVGLPVEAVVTDPRGLEIFSRKIALSSAAFEEASFKTDENSPTGTYQIGLYAIRDSRRRALLGSTGVRVEEFLPDRLRISARFSTERPEGWVAPDGLKALVSLRNLYGTPAENRRATARMTLSPAAPSFQAFPGYAFFDPSAAKKSFTERLSDAQTDEKGEASFDLDLARFAAGTYRLDVAAEGFEAGAGRGVGAEASVLVSPRPFLIGLKADGNLGYIARRSTRTVEIVAVGPDGRAARAPGLRYSIVEKRYVSALLKQDDGTYKYQSVQKEVLLQKTPLSLEARSRKISLPAGQPGDFALVVADEKGAALNRLEFSVVGRGNLARSLERNAELRVRLNKADFAPGEEIELEVSAPYVGAGLITIERDRVFAHKWFKTETTNSVQTIRVPSDLEGNAYVNVSFLRSPASKEIFMSPLSYGVAPFTVSLKRRNLPVELSVPEKIKPGETVRIRYRADRPSRVVVYAVDEGILQVAGYRTPDPLASFFRKRALEVRTFQILDLLLPEYAVALEAMAPGGDKRGFDAVGKNLNPFKRKRDKPAAFWSGLLPAGPRWREVDYAVPDSFNGTLRVMAVAASPSAIGVAEKKTLVRGPFVLTPSAPAFAAPGDELEVSVGVANGAAGSGPGAAIKLGLETSGHLQIVGPAARTLRIPEGHESSATFLVRARPALGSARLTFTAALGALTATRTVELSVRPPVPYRTTVVSGSLVKGTATEPTPRRMFPRYRLLEASVSPLPLGLARGLLQYLVKFPYGCTEQLVSQAFPALVLRGRPAFGYNPARVEAILQETLRVLRSRQTADGAFGLWAANSNVSSMAAIYALHFLTEAREQGYPVSDDLLSRGLSYAAAVAAGQPGGPGWHEPYRVRAYALYVLTRNGRVTTQGLETLRQELDLRDKSWTRDLTAVYLAASYKMLHLDREADALIAGASLGAVRPEDCDYEYLYDGMVHDAVLLYILARHFPERLDSLGADGPERLAEEIEAGRFNTLSSSYAILAFDAWARARGDVTGAVARLSERLDGGGRRALALPEGPFPVAPFSGQASAVDVEDAGRRRLYYQVTSAGFDLAVPKAEVKDGLEVQREFRDESGAVVDQVKLGGELAVHLKVRGVGGERPNVALVDLLPAGFEVVEDRRAPAASVELSDPPAAAPCEEEDCGEETTAPPETVGKTSLEGGWTPDYVDVREDRVVLFGRAARGFQEFVYRVKATNRGRVVCPPPFAESMYDRAVQARGLATEFEVQ